MKGWRTVAVNVLTFGAALFTWEDMSKFVDPQVIVMVQAGINFALRFVTTTAVGKPKEVQS